MNGIRQVVITPEALASLLSMGEIHARIENGLPPGARLVGRHRELGTGDLVLIYEHESWGYTDDGSVPHITPRMTRLRCGDALL